MAGFTPNNYLESRTDAQLHHNTGYVILDGLLLYPEIAGDFFIRQPSANRGYDFLLT